MGTISRTRLCLPGVQKYRCNLAWGTVAGDDRGHLWPGPLRLWSILARDTGVSRPQRPRSGISVPDPTPVTGWRSSPSCSPPEPGRALGLSPPERRRPSAWRWWPALLRRGCWQSGYWLRVAAVGLPHCLWQRRWSPPSAKACRTARMS
jgi:hypothetical protein